MKRTVKENTTGLFDEIQYSDIDIKIEPPIQKDYGCFYEVPKYDASIPLWGSTVTEESNFVKTIEL